MDKTFLAYQVEKKGDIFLGKVLERTISDLPKGNLTVKVFILPLITKMLFLLLEQKGLQETIPIHQE